MIVADRVVATCTSPEQKPRRARTRSTKIRANAPLRESLTIRRIGPRPTAQQCTAVHTGAREPSCWRGPSEPAALPSGRVPRMLPIALLMAASTGCGGALVAGAPDDPPEPMIATYADALSRGDAEA